MENSILGNVADDSILHVLVGRISPSTLPPFFTVAEKEEPPVAPTFVRTASPADSGWVALHRAAWSIELSDLPEWFAKWEARSIPCGSCRQHWAEYKKGDPPSFGSPVEFFWWSYRAHNSVSRRIGKSVWSCGRFYRRYFGYFDTSNIIG